MTQKYTPSWIVRTLLCVFCLKKKNLYPKKLYETKSDNFWYRFSHLFVAATIFTLIAAAVATAASGAAVSLRFLLLAGGAINFMSKTLNMLPHIRQITTCSSSGSILFLFLPSSSEGDPDWPLHLQKVSPLALQTYLILYLTSNFPLLFSHHHHNHFFFSKAMANFIIFTLFMLFFIVPGSYARLPRFLPGFPFTKDDRPHKSVEFNPVIRLPNDESQLHESPMEITTWDETPVAITTPEVNEKEIGSNDIDEKLHEKVIGNPERAVIWLVKETGFKEVAEKQLEKEIRYEELKEKNSEKPIRTEKVDEEEPEKLIETGKVDEKESEKPIRTGKVDEKQPEKPINVETVDEKEPEKPINVEKVDEKELEKAIRTGKVDEKEPEKPIRTGKVDEKEPVKPISVGKVDEKEAEKPIRTAKVDEKDPEKEIRIVEDTEKPKEKTNRASEVVDNPPETKIGMVKDTEKQINRASEVVDNPPETKIANNDLEIETGNSEINENLLEKENRTSKVAVKQLEKEITIAEVNENPVENVDSKVTENLLDQVIGSNEVVEIPPGESVFSDFAEFLDMMVPEMKNSDNEVAEKLPETETSTNNNEIDEKSSSETESSTVKSVPLRIAKLRPVNRHIRLKWRRSPRPCHHLHQRNHHLFPFGGDMLLPTGENGDFDPVIIHRHRVPRTPISVNYPHHIHHHHLHRNHDDSNHDNNEEESKSVFKHSARFGNEKFKKHIHHDDHEDEESEEDKSNEFKGEVKIHKHGHKDKGLLQRIRKMLIF